MAVQRTQAALEIAEGAVALMGVERHRFMVENWRALLAVLGSGERETHAVFGYKAGAGAKS